MKPQSGVCSQFDKEYAKQCALLQCEPNPALATYVKTQIKEAEGKVTELRITADFQLVRARLLLALPFRRLHTVSGISRAAYDIIVEGADARAQRGFEVGGTPVCLSSLGTFRSNL